MSKIVNVIPMDDFTLWIEFEHGNKILFNMQRMIRTLPYLALNNIECFKKIKIEDKALCWYDTGCEKQTILPIRLTVDNILFAIRD